MKKSDMLPTNAGYPLGIQDPKKTCNLETYLEWSSRLRLLVSNEILLVSLNNAHFILDKLNYLEQFSILLKLDLDFLLAHQLVFLHSIPTTTTSLQPLFLISPFILCHFLSKHI